MSDNQTYQRYILLYYCHCTIEQYRTEALSDLKGKIQTFPF